MITTIKIVSSVYLFFMIVTYVWIKVRYHNTYFDGTDISMVVFWPVFWVIELCIIFWISIKFIGDLISEKVEIILKGERDD